MSYDSILKFLIDEYSRPILTWLFDTEINEPVTMLNTELNIEPIRADGVFFLEVGGKIIHLEFQTRPKSKPPLPLRMLDYWVRLYRLYQKPIEQVIIFLRRDTSSMIFEDSFQVGTTNHRYRVIRIWECEPTPLLSQPELLPLAVLAKSEKPEVLLSQVAENLNKIEDQRQKSNLAACVELLAGINYSEELIKMYLHDDILKDSVTYQRMLKTGEISLLSRQLKRRFGEISETLKPKITTLSREQIELLGESIFDFNSFEDVINWLDNLNLELTNDL